MKVEDHIHQIRKVGVGDTSTLGDPVEIGFTNTENPHKEPPIIDPQDEKCYAKIIRTERESGLFLRYFVKATMDRKLVDPWDTTDLQRNGRLAASMGRDPYMFLEINKMGFDLYMLFLRGRSTAHFDKAAREIIHA
jgi:hypothetical protein